MSEVPLYIEFFSFSTAAALTSLICFRVEGATSPNPDASIASVGHKAIEQLRKLTV